MHVYVLWIQLPGRQARIIAAFTDMEQAQSAAAELYAEELGGAPQQIT